MSRKRVLCASVAVLILFLSLAGRALSQDARPTPEERRQRMEQRMKDTLGVTDEEWKTLKPKVEKVQTLARQVRGAGVFGRRPGEAPTELADVEKKLADFQKVLENKEAKAEDVAAALTAYREARTLAKTELEKAQKELLEGLNPRQLAGAVSLGLVD